MEQISNWHPVLQSFIAGLVTWGATSLGALVVFILSPPRCCPSTPKNRTSNSSFRSPPPSSSTSPLTDHGNDHAENNNNNNNNNSSTLSTNNNQNNNNQNNNNNQSSQLRNFIEQTGYGFAGGVMLAASFFSLLNPAVELCEEDYGRAWSWLPLSIGFGAGVLAIMVFEALLHRLEDLRLKRRKQNDFQSLREEEEEVSVSSSSLSLPQREDVNNNNNNNNNDIDDKRGKEEKTRQESNNEQNDFNDENDHEDFISGYQYQYWNNNNNNNIENIENKNNNNNNNNNNESIHVTVDTPQTPASSSSSSLSPLSPYYNSLITNNNTHNNNTHNNSFSPFSNKITFSERLAHRMMTSWHRIAGGGQQSLLLLLSITIHNLPEGIVLGVAFAAAASKIAEDPDDLSLFHAAVRLTLGVAIQDIPEGAAVSLPCLRDGVDVWRSFLFGSLSGILEPIGALIGAVSVLFSNAVLPYALSFSAGVMVHVVLSDLVPEAFGHNEQDYDEEEEEKMILSLSEKRAFDSEDERKAQVEKWRRQQRVMRLRRLRAAQVGFLSGFIIMMNLDISLG